MICSKKTTASGLKYFVLEERTTRNHPGGVSDNEDENQSVMMAWPGLVIPCALLLVWRSIKLTESQGAMPYGKNQIISMHVASVMMTTGFAAF